MDLAPPEHLRIFEDDLETILAARRAGTGPTEVRQQRVVSLRSTLTAYVRRVDLYTCNIGAGRMAPLLDRLRAVWDQPVRGLQGQLSSGAAPGPNTTVTMSIRGQRGSWTDELIPVRFWRDAQLLERPVGN